MVKQPDNISPTVRSPDFNFSQDIPDNWYAGKTHLSNFFDALSIGITPMEGFIIKVLRSYQENSIPPTPENEGLYEDTKAFVAQETQHSHLHSRYNNQLANRHYPVKEISAWFSDHIKTWNKNHNEQELLATVVAMESFLGDIGDVILSKSEYGENMDPRVRQLFEWHFYEEFEHRAVSYNLYSAIYGTGFSSYITRIRMYIKATGKSAKQIVVPLIALLKHNEINSLKSWLDILKFLFIKPGFYTQLLLRYFHYFSPTYHPWNETGYMSKLERFKKEIIQPEWENNNKEGTDL